MMPTHQDSGGILQPREAEKSDRWLLQHARAGDQDAATQLYDRYAIRLRSLVARQCSKDLARRAGVEDIVQSVFRSFFRRVGEGFYDVPDQEELWKLLLVLTLHKIRDKANYHHAAKRDSHRTLGGEASQRCLESQPDIREDPAIDSALVVDEILEHLSPESRMIVKLRIDGCQVAEVAQKVGCSRRSVERILQETRLRLTELLLEVG